MDGISENPWGVAYKMVRGKLIREVPPLELMDPEEVDGIFGRLFPREVDEFDAEV